MSCPIDTCSAMSLLSIRKKWKACLSAKAYPPKVHCILLIFLCHAESLFFCELYEFSSLGLCGLEAGWMEFDGD